MYRWGKKKILNKSGTAQHPFFLRVKLLQRSNRTIDEKGRHCLSSYRRHPSWLPEVKLKPKPGKPNSELWSHMRGQTLEKLFMTSKVLKNSNLVLNSGFSPSDFCYPRKEFPPPKEYFYPHSTHPIINIYTGVFMNDSFWCWTYIVLPDGQALPGPRLRSRHHVHICWLVTPFKLDQRKWFKLTKEQSWKGKSHSQESGVRWLDLFRFAFKLYNDLVKTPNMK